MVEGLLLAGAIVFFAQLVLVPFVAGLKRRALGLWVLFVILWAPVSAILWTLAAVWLDPNLPGDPAYLFGYLALFFVALPTYAVALWPSRARPRYRRSYVPPALRTRRVVPR